MRWWKRLRDWWDRPWNDALDDAWVDGFNARIDEEHGEYRSSPYRKEEPK